MKTFCKWSISLIWIFVVILLILGLSFLSVSYEGYYWNSNGLPVNVGDVVSFKGSGYDFIQQLGIDKLLNFAVAPSFSWGYVDNIQVNGIFYNLGDWLAMPGNVINGVIQWPLMYELTTGTNFVEVIGGILVVLLVAVPFFTLIGIYLTIRLVKGMTRPYSIEYIDARKGVKKVNKSIKKSLKKLTKEIKQGTKKERDLVILKESCQNSVIASKKEFELQKDLFKKQYSRNKTNV